MRIRVCVSLVDVDVCEQRVRVWTFFFFTQLTLKCFKVCLACAYGLNLFQFFLFQVGIDIVIDCTNFEADFRAPTWMSLKLAIKLTTSTDARYTRIRGEILGRLKYAHPYYWNWHFFRSGKWVGPWWNRQFLMHFLNRRPRKSIFMWSEAIAKKIAFNFIMLEFRKFELAHTHAHMFRQKKTSVFVFSSIYSGQNYI